MSLDDFINNLNGPASKRKTAEDLKELPIEVLAELAGVRMPGIPEKVAAYEAKVSRYMGKCCDPEFLEQFEGTPLYPQAVALAEQELEMEKRHLQARMSRRMRDDSWEQESNERDMLDIQKSQLMLELHKQKAQAAQAASMAATAPPMPGMAPGALPAEAPAEMAAEKMAYAKEAADLKGLPDSKQERGLGKALSALARKKMDPDQKRGLLAGISKAIKSEQKEGDPVKLSSLRDLLNL